ncbi:MAG: hypothetical protein MJ174_04830 [Treponema sp.]|nr:hypothetical protein [Treponema sp.]
MNSELILFIIQMVVQGIVSFLAILVMSKTRAPSWMFIVAGFLFFYVALIFELMIKLGVLTNITATLFGLPLLNLLSITIPGLFFIIGLILKLFRK